jgi:hypothetical protein
MLFVPFALGVLVAWSGAGRLVFLGIAITLLFIGRESVLAWWRARSRGNDPASATRLMVIYLGLAAVAGSPLVFYDRLYGMIPLGLITTVLLVWNAQQAVKREERTVFTEIFGIIGLTLTAPAAYCAGLGRWNSTALWLWGLCALYFASSVFYVKLRVLTAHSKNMVVVSRIKIQCAAYHVVLGILLATAVSAGDLHPYLLVAYAPIVIRALWHVLRPTKQLVLKRIGWTEVLYSLVFLLFAVAGFRSG